MRCNFEECELKEFTGEALKGRNNCGWLSGNFKTLTEARDVTPFAVRKVSTHTLPSLP